MESPALTIARSLNTKKESLEDVSISWLSNLIKERQGISVQVQRKFHSDLCTKNDKETSSLFPLKSHCAECNQEEKEEYPANEEQTEHCSEKITSTKCTECQNVKRNYDPYICQAEIIRPSYRANFLELHALHRRRLYSQFGNELSHKVDKIDFHNFMMWCHEHDLFIHPAVYAKRQPNAFRDHAFYVKEDVPRLTPLIAIPESVLIGFVNLSEESDNTTTSNSNSSNSRTSCNSRAYIENNLYDAQREREFSTLNVSTEKMNEGKSKNGDNDADTDICDFFFRSLGMIVADLITAHSSPLSDHRHAFAHALSKIRTIQNAPYFDDDVVFSPDEPCLADVFLQMIRNYVNGGPLVNKVSRSELQWAVSVCLSHSTPLCISSTKSIGLIPLIHLFPHGGALTNCYIVSRTTRSEATMKMNAFFSKTFNMDFSVLHDGKWIYVVPDRALSANEEIHLQAMAPVCDSDDAAEQMWRLSCGAVPSTYKTSAEVAARQRELSDEIVTKGSEAIHDLMQEVTANNKNKIN